MAEQGDDDFAKAFAGCSRRGFAIFRLNLRRRSSGLCRGFIEIMSYSLEWYNESFMWLTS